MKKFKTFSSFNKKTKAAVGLDIGSSAVKSVMLELGPDGKVTLQKFDLFEARAEGIVDEKELFSSAVQRVGEFKSPHATVAVGLPQFFGSTQINDFPELADDQMLGDLVAAETRQLGGLSEENYLYDYQRITPGAGRQNPVFIVVCRENSVREYIEAVQTAGLEFAELSMTGVGMVNALASLHPEAFAAKGLQIILDLGSDNTEMAVVRDGDLVMLNNLNFGAGRFTAVLQQSLSIDEAQAEQYKRSEQARISEDYDQQSLLESAQGFAHEIGYTLEQWLLGEPESLAGQKPARIWLCGAGAKLRGLEAFLQKQFECPVTVFGPADPAGGTTEPGYATAYGLALQGVGAARFHLSFLPASIRWQQKRRANLWWLIGATAALHLGLFIWLWHSAGFLQAEQSKLSQYREDLTKCNEIATAYSKAKLDVDSAERVCVPFISRGSTLVRVMRTLDAVGKAADGDKLFIAYIGLPGDFLKPKEPVAGQPKPPVPVVKPASGMGALFGNPTAPHPAAGAAGGAAGTAAAGGGMPVPNETLIPVHTIPNKEAIFLIAVSRTTLDKQTAQLDVFRNTLRGDGSYFSKIDLPEGAEYNKDKIDFVVGYLNKIQTKLFSPGDPAAQIPLNAVPLRVDFASTNFFAIPPPTVRKGGPAKAGPAPVSGGAAEEGSAKGGD
jgi:type IV pilus assembly protein PilM